MTSAIARPAEPVLPFEPPFRTQVKGLASYTIPKVDVQVSAAFQSLPGSSSVCELHVRRRPVTAALGRAPTGGINTLAINLVEPG